MRLLTHLAYFSPRKKFKFYYLPCAVRYLLIRPGPQWSKLHGFITHSVSLKHCLGMARGSNFTVNYYECKRLLNGRAYYDFSSKKFIIIRIVKTFTKVIYLYNRQRKVNLMLYAFNSTQHSQLTISVPGKIKNLEIFVHFFYFFIHSFRLRC